VFKTFIGFFETHSSHAAVNKLPPVQLPSFARLLVMRKIFKTHPGVDSESVSSPFLDRRYSDTLQKWKWGWIL